MNHLITLKKDYEIKLRSKVTIHNTPKYVFIPYDKKDNLLIETEVLKEQKLQEHIISPISGTIKGTKYCLTSNGALVSCIAILNDYKEKFFQRKASIKDLSKVSFEKIVIDLKEAREFSLADKLWNSKPGCVIILNGIEDEPYVANEIFINKIYVDDILTTLDVIREKRNASDTKIVIKNNDRENIESFENHIGTFANMELDLVPDFYLIGKEEYLKEYLNIKESSLILKPSEIRKICQIVKRHRLITEHLFTISGDGIENPQIIEAKIGSSVKEIIESYIKINEKEVDFYINGLMTGRKLEIDNLIVTEELNSILIMKKDTLAEKECINCGKCVTVCPVHCNPKEVYEGHGKKYSQNCIDCGLCSYICPSFINLRKYLKGEENE